MSRITARCRFDDIMSQMDARGDPWIEQDDYTAASSICVCQPFSQVYFHLEWVSARARLCLCVAPACLLPVACAPGKAWRGQTQQRSTD